MAARAVYGSRRAIKVHREINKPLNFSERVIGRLSARLAHLRRCRSPLDILCESRTRLP